MTPCPCGSGRTFNTCCEPFIRGISPAPTAEALMRSRYSAFVTGDLDYVERTHAPETRDAFNRAEIEAMMGACAWQSLQIRKAVEHGDTAQVEFVARYRYNQKDLCQTEVSNFRRENGQWLYVDGTISAKQIPARNENKIGRNDPCPCGSGKKAKKCCGTDRPQH